MALLFPSRSPLLFSNNPRTLSSQTLTLQSIPSISLLPTIRTHIRLPSLRISSSASPDTPEPISGDDGNSESAPKISDEWGDEYQPEPEASYTKLADSDPPKNEDEWEEIGVADGAEDSYARIGNGSPKAATKAPTFGTDTKLQELKRCLVDTVYGTEFGFRSGVEVRAEVLELVNQLEAANPTPAPVEAAELLDGNWIMLFTAFSELLPLLAVGATPLLKVDKITQSIDTRNLTIVNSTVLSGPFATFSFSASATFEVRTPTKIQVAFKEGTLEPPEIKSRVELPENVDVFGQKINLLPVQQALNPVQDVVASISRAISGQPPLKVPIPGERASSWLLVTFLDEDLRISRGDGGLFILAREGSPLMNQ